MADERTPLDHLLDLVLYGPVGFLAEAHELMPRLAETGRHQLDHQVRTARMIGQFVVTFGRHKAEHTIRRLGDQASPAANPAAEPPSPRLVAPELMVVAPAPAAADVDDQAAEIEIAVRGAEPAPPTSPVPLGDDLAIPSYDMLAASQVVPRLDGLTESELDAVRRYETAHRGRKTILGRIAQLQGP
jgi:hypothetical protein